MNHLSAVLSAFFVAFVFHLPFAGADVIFDNFDADGGFSEAYLAVAGDVNIHVFQDTFRSAAQFAVTGNTYSLDSVTLPFSHTSTVPGDFVRIRLTADDAGQPGTTLETLSENQNIWSPNPVVATLPSAGHPVLTPGNYWIVAELTATPATTPGNSVAAFWHTNTSSSYVTFRQQNIEGRGIPSDPWTGYIGPIEVAFRVEGTIVPEPLSLSLLTVTAMTLLRQRR
jgi:hypothetical protein